jgi:hypothetical protein
MVVVAAAQEQLPLVGDMVADSSETVEAEAAMAHTMVRGTMVVLAQADTQEQALIVLEIQVHQIVVLVQQHQKAAVAVQVDIFPAPTVYQPVAA